MKKGVITAVASIIGIVAMIGILAVVSDNIVNRDISGYTSKNYCSKIADKFDKYYDKLKCDENNESKKCQELQEKYAKKITKKCMISDDGSELLFTGTASSWEDNGANDKVESSQLNSYDYDELTGYKLKWKQASTENENYSGKEYKILYNTPKCTNQACVILEGFNLADGTSNSVNGWKFEVVA